MNDLSFGIGFGRLHKRSNSLRNLLNDEFTTAASAPLVTPRICEPGPGRLLVTDTTNRLTISGGNLVFAGGTGTWNDPGFYGQTPFATMPGRCLIYRFTIPSSGQVRLGYNDAPSSFLYTHYVNINAVNAWWDSIGQFTAGAEYQLAIVFRGAAGALWYLKGDTLDN